MPRLNWKGMATLPYELYFQHAIPLSYRLSLSGEELEQKAHDALVKGEPVKEWAASPRIDNPVDVMPQPPKLSKADRDEVREEYLSGQWAKDVASGRELLKTQRGRDLFLKRVLSRPTK